jgi:D-alanyl-D-alanine carboxypeptidase
MGRDWQLAADSVPFLIGTPQLGHNSIGHGITVDNHSTSSIGVLVRVLRSAMTLTLLVLLGSSVRALAAPQYAAIVVDAPTGLLLHETNIYARTQPASLTKIMTAYLTFDALDRRVLRLDDLLAVSAHAAVMEPSRLGIRAGQQIRLRDALQATITKSANDTAVVLAEAIGGSESRFADLMNQHARRLGMLDTHFVNASGLPNDLQFTTARDMAILARGLMARFPHYYPLFSVTQFQYNGVTHYTHNHLLTRYTGSDGMKTGYVRASGFNLVASARRLGRRLIAVVLGGHSVYARDQQMMALLDHGFATLTERAKKPAIGQLAGASTTLVRGRPVTTAALQGMIPRSTSH